MTKIVLAAACCLALVACSGGSDDGVRSGSSTPPAATNTIPNANQDQMHNTDTGNSVSNKPTSGD